MPPTGAILLVYQSTTILPSTTFSVRFNALDYHDAGCHSLVIWLLQQLSQAMTPAACIHTHLVRPTVVHVDQA